MAKPLLILFFAWLVSGFAQAASQPSVLVARSQTGQFSARTLQETGTRNVQPVRVPIAGGWAFTLGPGQGQMGESDQLQLEPALIVVSCERLKATLLSELGMADQWQGRISLLVDSSLPADEEPALTAIVEQGGWNYELVVPPSIKPQRFFRSLVHVMLLEIANRSAGGDSAQIPLWLVEGMTEHLRACNLPTFVVQPKTTLIGNGVRLQGLEAVRARMREKTPLAFQELCWPDAEKIDGKEREFYNRCAQLLVYELLSFKDGRPAMRQMLADLPQYLNWQTAFLRAFHSHFGQLLDVEKWWGLACVNFMGRDASQAWTREESWRKLQEILDVPVEIHLSAERLPAPAVITFQEVIMQWDKTEEIAVLQRKVEMLTLVRPRLAPEAAQMADAYRTALEAYLRGHQSRRLFLTGKTQGGIKKAVCKRLTALDAQCAALRSKMAAR